MSRGWAERRLTFLYLCIGEEEDTPTRKRVTRSESLEQRLGTVEADISVLLRRRKPLQEMGKIERVPVAEADISVLQYR